MTKKPRGKSMVLGTQTRIVDLHPRAERLLKDANQAHLIDEFEIEMGKLGVEEQRELNEIDADRDEKDAVDAIVPRGWDKIEGGPSDV